jgi:D-alanyl-D-alanine carboxypeptidase/D-alanyl-D-alanine-endopeptidase (penicillin-binding protein 4)
VFLRLFSFLAILIFGVATNTNAAPLEAKLKRLVKHGCVWVAEGTEPVFQYPKGCNDLLAPASLLKLATTSLAIRTLGLEHRFKTEFWLTSDGELGIRGFGDPLLISEVWPDIAQALAARPELPRNLAGIVLDTSAFAPKLRIPGIENSLNPYDARNGALVTNFNTVYVRIVKNGTVTSMEPQTPLIPLAVKLAQGLKSGKHRINFSRQSEHVLPYFAGLARSFLGREGFTFASEQISERKLSSEDRRLLVFLNPNTLAEILPGMLLYSNNFTTNQLLLAAGAARSGYPATLEKGLAVLRHHLHEELGIPKTEVVAVEGSGISRKNRLTPAAVIRLLEELRPHQEVLPLLNEEIPVKTGTLRGIYGLAGYLPNGQTFAILLNQRKNTREAVLKALRKAGFGR